MGVISVRKLGKQYHLGSVRYNTLRDHIAAMFKRREEADAASFWALKDISFEVEQGEVVGIIGRNGAGKSTLLKVLSQITEPTAGEVRISGRVASLLEVGTGFHPELSGSENIFLNGSILGMSKREISTKFDEIVAFAEVEKFIDTPVKHYSSGMYVRLAFAVAAHLEPEILIVDEVLAVGDAVFQKKCLSRMDDVSKQGKTVLFVSHNMAAVNRLCSRVVWLSSGCVQQDGTTEEVTASYLTSGANLSGHIDWPEGIANPGISELRIHRVQLSNVRGETAASFDAREPITVELEYEIISPLPPCRIGIIINTVNGVTVFEAYDADHDRYAGERKPGRYVNRCEVPARLLNADRYTLTINAGIPYVKNLAKIDDIITFEIENTVGFGKHLDFRRAGVIDPQLQWEVIAV